MQRYLSSSYGYKYFSSPFTSETISGFSSYVNLSDTFPAFYQYEENLTSTGWVIDTAADTELYPMHGYAANFGSSTSAETVSLTGVVNNGTMSFTLYNHNNTYTLGYNLVGNPYPSPINWEASTGWTKTNIDDAIYYFNAGGTDIYSGTYSSYVGGVSSDGVASKIIPAMQAFFIHVSNGAYPVTGTLAMTNSVRVDSLSPVFHRASGTTGTPLLRLTAGFANSVTDAAVLYFNDSATGNFDNSIDALKFLNTDANVPNLYSLSQDAQTQFSIQALQQPADTSTTVVPLGLVTAKDGTIAFNAHDIESMPSGLHIYFYDAKTGFVNDLNSTPTYSQFLASGNYENRFFILFSYKSRADIPVIVGQLNAYTSGDDLFVYLNYGTGAIVLTDMLGQVITKQDVSGNGYHQINCPVAAGVYIATLYSNMGRQSKEIILGTK